MAVRFDAAGDQLGRTTNLPDYNGVYSWMGQFYLTSDTNAVGAALGLTNAGGTEYDFCGVTADGTTLSVDAGVGSGQGVLALSLATWYTIGMVRASDTSLTCYVYDGTTLTQNTDIGNVAARGTLTSMAVGGALGTYLWNGKTCGHKLWNRAISAAEFVNEAKVLRVLDPTSLYGHWPMLSGASEYVKDYSGNGNDFTAGGSLTEEQEAPISWGSNVFLFPYVAAGGGVFIKMIGNNFRLAGNGSLAS